MTYRIPLVFDSFGAAERRAVAEVLESGCYTQGRRVAAFERRFADYAGARHALLVNSGSSANLLAVTACVYARLWPDHGLVRDLAPGDEVIVPGLCWPTTLTPLLNLGLRPVFCDIAPGSLNAGTAEVGAVLTARTAAVIAVPVLGEPTGMAELAHFCNERGLVLIEDACESLGAVAPDGRRIGSLGAVGSFSFYFSHHMTTIEGGCLVTDSPVIATVARALRDHGWVRNLEGLPLPESLPSFPEADDRYCFFLPGYNVRPTEVTAALGAVQLDRLEAGLARRRTLADGRIAALAPFRNAVTVPGAAAGAAHSWMAFPLLFGSPELRDAVQSGLEAAGIETRPLLVGNILRHPVAGLIDGAAEASALPGCDRVLRTGLLLGLTPGQPDGDEEFLMETLARALAGAGVDGDR